MEEKMKNEIHPEYVEAKVTCSCGESFTTRATVPELKVEICSNCHPFYTGKQKLVDSGGRVERFQRKYGKQTREAEKEKKDDGGKETVSSRSSEKSKE